MYLSQFRCISTKVVKCWRFCLLMRLIEVLFWILLVVDFKLLRDKLFEGFQRGRNWISSLNFFFLGGGCYYSDAYLKMGLKWSWNTEAGVSEIYGGKKKYFILRKYQRLIPVAVWSKARVCGRLVAANTGSNPAGSMSVCCECCVLSGRGLCDGLIPRPEESYRLCVCVCVCVWERERER